MFTMLITMDASHFETMIKLSKENSICPFCGKNKYRSFYRETPSGNEILHYRGFCSDCGFCRTQLEYQCAQEQMIADNSNDYASYSLQRAGVDYDEKAPVKMLQKKYISAGLKKNNLYRFLIRHFYSTAVKRICNLYNVATHTVGEWEGSAIFYQFNKDDQCQAVKIIQYDENGHRITADDKNDENSDLLYQKPLMGKGNYCLFGRHLLNRPDSTDKPICIVESEKTALMAAIAYPEAIWMAAGSCYYLYDKKLDADFKEREIILFPDIDVKYEPIDIDEEKGTIRCINWYVIKERFRQELQKYVSVSGFLDSFIRDKCEKCDWKEVCSSSPSYETNNAKIQSRNMGFKLKNKPEITSLPKIVLEDENTKKEMNCPFRGWDLADYILYAKQNNETLASFNELKKVIDEKLLTCIKGKISSLENNIGLTDWINDIQQGIELIEKKEDNTNNKK